MYSNTMYARVPRVRVYYTILETSYKTDIDDIVHTFVGQNWSVTVRCVVQVTYRRAMYSTAIVCFPTLPCAFVFLQNLRFVGTHNLCCSFVGACSRCENPARRHLDPILIFSRHFIYFILLQSYGLSHFNMIHNIIWDNCDINIYVYQ